MATPIYSDQDFQNVGGVGPKILNLSAREDAQGVIEIATQAEVDAGVDDTRAVTPLKLKNAASTVKKFAATIGDGTAVSYPVNHNLNSDDVVVEAYLVAAPKTSIGVQVDRTSVNQVTVLFAVAPALNSIRVVVLG